MVVGRDFAWGHLGKTGGDATWALFQCVKDLVVRAHETSDPAKHRTFVQEETDHLPILALNLRRLPTLVLSHVNHAYRYGVEGSPKGIMMTPEDALEFPQPDAMLDNFTDARRLRIGVWLRMENLRDDFLDFVQLLRPLTDDEIERIWTVPTKAPMPYDHDPRSFFTDDQIRELYRRNPFWTRTELQVYGDLPEGVEAPAALRTPVSPASPA